MGKRRISPSLLKSDCCAGCRYLSHAVSLCSFSCCGNVHSVLACGSVAHGCLPPFCSPFHVSRRKQQKAKVGAPHKIDKHDTMKWFQQKVRPMQTDADRVLQNRNADCCTWRTA